MSPQAKKRSSILPVLVVVVLGGVLWGGFRDGGWFREVETGAVLGAEVQRGPMRVTVVQRGNLSAKNSAKVISELEGRNQILWLIEEGTQVEPGALIAELDVSQLQDKLVEQDISVQNAEAALTKAEQELEIQRSQNVSDIAKAEQDLLNAQKEFEKYEFGDWPKDEAEALDKIAQAEAAAAKAQDDLKWTQELFDAGFETRTRLVQDTIAEQSATIRKEQADRELAVLREYDRPKQLRILTAAIEEANRELERVNLQASARLVDALASERTSRAKHELEAAELIELTEQVAKAKLYAPAAGMVVYAREEGSWRSEGNLIEEGAEVRERQEIVTIPQSGGMIVEATLHESVVRKVAVGMPCTVSVDSIPSTVFRGRISFVALLPDKGSMWSNPNLRIFRTHAEILEASPEMRPGMSCNIEILVDEIPDTIYVPVQAVFRDGPRRVAFVDGAMREVEVGQSTEKYVQILSGLEVGEVVAMAPPSGWVPEPAPTDEPPEAVPGGAGGEGMTTPGGAGMKPGGGGMKPGGGGAMPGGGQRPGNGQRPGGGERPGSGQANPGGGRDGGQ